MDLKAFYNQNMNEHRKVLEDTVAQCYGPFEKLVAACVKSIRAGGKIVWFGNGGSAANAQDLATELVVRYMKNRKPIASLALTTDTSILTAAANDFGYETVFARQVEALVKKEDVVIGISTSGKSANVLRGLEAARTIGAVAAGFTGGTGGQMTGLADPLIVIPSTITSRIQEMHITLGQMLCGALEIELGLVE